MAIRCAAKAIIVNNGRILLNRCCRQSGKVYYDLPGGGQHPFESMEQAVLREVKEETGYTVRILRFAAVAEEIHTNPELQKKHPDYAHRMMHIFLAEIDGEDRDAPTEKDWGMEECVWIPVEEVKGLPEVRPTPVKERLDEILNSGAPVYLGTEFVHWDHE